MVQPAARPPGSPQQDRDAARDAGAPRQAGPESFLCGCRRPVDAGLPGPRLRAADRTVDLLRRHQPDHRRSWNKVKLCRPPASRWAAARSGAAGGRHVAVPPPPMPAAARPRRPRRAKRGRWRARRWPCRNRPSTRSGRPLAEAVTAATAEVQSGATSASFRSRRPSRCRPDNNAARGHHHGQTAGDAPIPIHAVAARRPS